MTDKSTKEKVAELEAFAKEAFCIDGSAEFVVEAKIFHAYIKMTDSRRGTFYLAWTKGTKE